MPTLGPYIKFTEQTATHWCYLEIKPGVIKYYEALYTDLVDGLIWQESVLPDDNYLYDPKAKKALGYFMRSDQLYQIPLQILNTQICVNQVLEIKLINNEITTPLAPRRAKTFNVDLKLYPDTKHFNVEKIPLLINDVTAIEAPLDIDAGSAHDCLKVSRCLIINDETQVPVILSDNIMYVWKIAEEWLFTVGFLGEVRSGKFDQELDQKVIHVFNTLESDNHTEIDLATFDFMQVALTRPYLILSHEQQTKVISTFMCSWPLDDNLSRIENIQICRSVVTGIVLNETDVADLEKRTNLNNEIYFFRHLLFPEKIDAYFIQNFYTNSSAIGNDTTIADVILFVRYLLSAMAKKLGDHQPMAITQPPLISRVKCGELTAAQPSAGLVYQNLSEQHSEFLAMIMNYYENGIHDLNIEQLFNFVEVLSGLVNQNNYHIVGDLANQLLAMYCAQHDLPQEQSQQRLLNLYMEILHNVQDLLALKLCVLPEQQLSPTQRHYLELLKENSSSERLLLINTFMVDSEWYNFLQEKDLFTTLFNYFCEIISQNHTEISEWLNVLQSLIKEGFLEHAVIKSNLSVIFNSKLQVPVHMLSVLSIIINYFVLTDELFDAVAKTHNHLNVFSNLVVILSQKIKLIDNLTVEFIGFLSNVYNSDVMIAVMKKLHKFGLPITVANLDFVRQYDVLDINCESNWYNIQDVEILFTGPDAQYNYSNILKVQQRGGVITSLIELKRKGILNADIVRIICETTKRNIDTMRFIINNSREIVQGIIMLHENNLLIPDYIEFVCAHLSSQQMASVIVLCNKEASMSCDWIKMVAQHQYPLDALNNMLFIKKHPELDQNQVIQDQLINLIKSHQNTLLALLKISNKVPLTNHLVSQLLTFDSRNSPGFLSYLENLIKEAPLLDSEFAAEIIDFMMVNKYYDLTRCIKALCNLYKYGLMTVENFKIFKERLANDDALIYLMTNNSFSALINQNILAQKIYTTIALADEPLSTARELLKLNAAGLLSESQDQQYLDILMCKYPSNKANVIIELDKLNLFSSEVAAELRFTQQPLKVLEKAIKQKEVEDAQYIGMGFSM